MRNALLLICLCATELGAQEASPPCLHPAIRFTTGDHPFSSVVWDSVPVPGTDRSRRVAHPAFSAPVSAGDLVGDYDLVVILAAPSAPDTIETGSLFFRLTPPSRRAEWLPAFGWSDVDLGRLGVSSLAHPIRDENPFRPGVEPRIGHGGRTLTLMLGNAIDYREDGSVIKTTDSGAIFTVFEATPTGLSGWWSDGGMSSQRPEGYFCAVRRSSPDAPALPPPNRHLQPSTRDR